MNEISSTLTAATVSDNRRKFARKYSSHRRWYNSHWSRRHSRSAVFHRLGLVLCYEVWSSSGESTLRKVASILLCTSNSILIIPSNSFVFCRSCFIIEADKTDHNRVIGHVKLNPEFPILIDYEEYEVLYLAIFVTDLNQEVNDATADGNFTDWNLSSFRL